MIAVLGVRWPLDQTFGHGHGEGPGQLISILLPIGAATVLRWKAGDGFADAGLRPLHHRNRAWYLLSSSSYPVVMIAAMAGGVVVGDGETYDDWAP